MIEQPPKLGVCMIAESYYPNVDGGAIHSRLLAKELSRLGAKVTVITRRTKFTYLAKEDVDGIPITRIGADNRRGRFFRYLGMLSLCRPLFNYRRDYQVILVSTPRILGLPAVIMSKFLGKRCILKPDTCGEMDGTYALMDVSESSLVYRIAKIYFLLRNAILKRANAFVAISNPLIEELTRIGVGRHNIFRIPNGIDMSRFSPVGPDVKKKLREQLGVSESSLVFVYCGRLSREKGLHLLLRVWGQLCQSYDDIHLMLVGSGEGLTLGCEGELREFVSTNHLDSTVTFTGAVDDVTRFLHCADVFILPSWSETQSLALVEAQACGLPAIATRVGGLPEVVDHNSSGLLVTLNDEAEMQEAAVRLIEDEALRERFGSIAREIVLQRFSISRVAEEYMRVLQAPGKEEAEIL